MGKRRDLLRTISDPEFLRFLFVGAINTAYGYGLFAGFNWLFENRVPHGYLLALIVSNIVSITLNYIAYKLFVFRTTGNYLREYLKFYVVYGVSFIVGLGALPIFVEGLKLNSYLAGALLIPITVLISFFGHKKFSFAAR